MDTSILKIICLVLLLVSFYFFLGFIKKKFKLKPEATRKIAHLVSGGMAMFLFYFFRRGEFLALLAFFSLFFILAKKTKMFPAIHLDSRKTEGEIFFPIGLLFVVFFAYQNKFVALSATAILTISDTLAEIAGTYLKKTKKSGPGSLAFFISAFAIIYFLLRFFHYPINLYFISVAAITAAIATKVEAISKNGSDNLTIPVAVITMLYLFLHF